MSVFATIPEQGPNVVILQERRAHDRQSSANRVGVARREPAVRQNPDAAVGTAQERHRFLWAEERLRRIALQFLSPLDAVIIRLA